jgi:hypothetical protein
MALINNHMIQEIRCLLILNSPGTVYFQQLFTALLMYLMTIRLILLPLAKSFAHRPAKEEGNHGVSAEFTTVANRPCSRRQHASNQLLRARQSGTVGA